MAANTSHSASGFSSGDTPSTMTAETASFRSVSQPSRAGLSVRVELIERSLRDQQFSDAVTRRLTQTVRASTAGIYDCKSQVYESWCHMQQISPLKATVQQLADFYEFLFSSRKLVPCTIKGYRLAISTAFHLQGGWNPGTDQSCLLYCVPLI